MMRSTLALVLACAIAALAQEPPAGEVGTHVVQPGETLEMITTKYLGSSRQWRENWRLNPELKDPNGLRPGQTIRVFLSLADRAASITAVSRRVDQKVADDDWTDARLGQKLRERDGLRTGPRSSAALGLGDGTDLVIGETSIVFLREISGRMAAVPRQALEVIEGQADVGRSRPANPSAAGEIEVIIGGTRARSRPGEGGSQLRNRRTKDGVAQVMSYGGQTDVESAGARVTLPEGTGTAVLRNQAPGAPERLLPAAVVIEPSAGAAVDHSNPTFRWRAVEGATQYTVEVCRDAACGGVVERGTTKVTSWTVPRLPIGRYFWRVTPTAPSGLDGYPTKTAVIDIKALWRRPPPSPSPSPAPPSTSPPRI